MGDRGGDGAGNGRSEIRTAFWFVKDCTLVAAETGPYTSKVLDVGVFVPVNKIKNDSRPAAPSTSAKYDILIVDDDQRTASALGRILRGAGFTTAVVHTGKDAIQHIKQAQICAAILDVHLPDLNGLVLSRSLREQLGEGVPIFVVSGDTSMETINSLPYVGVTHFFAKPMSPAYLIERLHECL